MKKILTLIALAAGTGAVFSQGIVNFNNNVFNPLTGPPDHSVYAFSWNGPVTTDLTGTQYVAELYVGPNASSLSPLTASLSRFRVTGTTFPGTWSGKNPVALGMGGIGVPVILDVRVWDTTVASSYEAVSTAANGYGFGESGPFTYTQVLSSPSVPSDTFMVGMPAFWVSVPEPSAIAFSILGIIGLLLFRRQKPKR